MDAAGACTAGVSVSTLAKCVKDGASRSRVGSGGGGGADGGRVCFLFHLFFCSCSSFCVSLHKRKELGEKRWMLGDHTCG